MSYLGKVYSLVKQENFDGFLKSAGLSDDKIQALVSDKPTQKMEANGDSYSITSTGIGGERTVSFKSGVEFDDVIGAGESVKSMYTVDGNVVTHVVKGDAGVATFKKEYNGDDLVVTITSSNWDGVARRYYKA
uniref:Fatty acid-binding protein 2 n=1 Tax=Manduca sexta TaxID=7130 RepID=FABP2_MANSE|nr:RecName: Full=Fatty acid-binding protein 2; Short=FABP 2 [Manduca sexta]AAA29314.1 fatty acid binding protein 2 [Manduca sexta]